MMPRGNPSQTYQEALARLGFAQAVGCHFGHTKLANFV